VSLYVATNSRQVTRDVGKKLRFFGKNFVVNNLVGCWYSDIYLFNSCSSTGGYCGKPRFTVVKTGLSLGMKMWVISTLIPNPQD